MRIFQFRLPTVLLATFLATLAFNVPAAARAELGREPERIARSSDLEPGHGAVIISLRSELYLVAPLDLFLVREGGDPTDPADVVQISRSESRLSFGGNSTTKYKVRAVQLAEGRYRLAAHGAKCPKIPEPDERCLAEVTFAGIGETVSFPSRGYGEDAPVIEVRAGELTVAGDFGLTARNTIEWSQIPPDKLAKLAKKFADLPRAPEPEVGEDFQLKFPLRPRSMNDDRG
ncbi:MAG: hypothetical protein AAGA34_15835, partial [Pseudomonadota bacterium]